MSQTTSNPAAVLRAVNTDLVVEERPVPVPGPGEVLISNKFIAINPIDWMRQTTGMNIPFCPQILGHDVSGVVAGVGDGVEHVQPGDRVVAAMHQFVTHKLDNGAFQAFAVAPVATIARLPANTSLEQGAGLVTSVFTAASCLFDVLGLPCAWLERGIPVGTAPAADAPSIVIWGGASQVGVMVIQLARLAGLRVFTTASPGHHNYLRSLGAHVLVDYRSPTAIQDLLTASKEAGAPIGHVLAAISTPETLNSCLEILRHSDGAPAKRLCHSLQWPEDLAGPDADIEAGWVQGQDSWGPSEDLATWLFHKALPRWLEQGLFTPPRYRVIGKGMGAIQGALNEVKKGVSGEKILVEV